MNQFSVKILSSCYLCSRGFGVESSVCLMSSKIKNFYFLIFESYFRFVVTLAVVDGLSLCRLLPKSYVQGFIKLQDIQDGRIPPELILE